jgi:hypothetical protein
MFAVSAEANTSAGAPAMSCATRSDDPAKLNVTVDPGFSCWKIVPMWVKVALSDAAANTVSVAEPLGGADAAALEPPALDEAELEALPLDDTAELAATDALLEGAELLPPELQPTAVAARQAAVAATKSFRTRRFTRFLRESR